VCGPQQVAGERVTKPVRADRLDARPLACTADDMRDRRRRQRPPRRLGGDEHLTEISERGAPIPQVRRQRLADVVRQREALGR
jgi:hypothetical protein